MRNLFTIAFMLVCTTLCAQDTLCVMVCLDRVLHFDYSTNEIIDKEYNSGEVEIKVEDDEILVLHFYDKKRRFRDVKVTFSDGDHMQDTFKTRSDVLYSKSDWPSFVINISEARTRK